MQWRQVLLERKGEVSVLDSARSEAGSDGRVVVIEGPAGIGKTRLLDVLRQPSEGAMVLSAHGGVLERDMPFGVVRQLFERLLTRAAPAERAGLLAGAASPAADALGLAATPPPPGASDLGRSLHGLYWLVANLADAQPLVLIVDDVPWADAPSLELFAYLARRIEGLPVLLAMTARDGEPWSSDEARSVLLAGAKTIRPAPLTGAGVAELVSLAFAGPVPEQLVDACRAATGGNPFYLGELLGAIGGPDRDPTDVPIDAVRATVPSTVARSILLRVGRLGDAAVRLASAAALLGDDTALRHAAALAELSPTEAEKAADALVGVLIFASTQPIRFVHPIVESAIAGEMPQARRGSLHRQAALVLLGDGAPVERAAPHLLRATPASDPRVVDALRLAAIGAAASGVPAAAVQYLRRALDEPPQEDEFSLFVQLSAAELASGAYADSVKDAQRAVDLAPAPVARAHVRLLQSVGLMSVEGAAAALRVLAHGADEAAGADPDLALQLEGQLAAQSWMAGVPYPVGERLGHLCDLAGETYGERWALAVLAGDALARAEPAETVRHMALRSLSDGRLLADQSATTMAYYVATLGLLGAEAFDDARHAIADGIADTQARGMHFGYAGICWLRGLLALAEGDLPSAEADERTCVEHAVPTMVGIGVASLALVLLEQGDVEGAAAELARGGLLSDDRPLYVWGPYVRGLIRLAQGRVAEAVADLEDVGYHGREVGGMSAWLPWRAHLALAYEAAGEHERAVRLAEEELERANRHGGARMLGTALRAAGLLATANERLDLLGRAVTVLSGSPARLDLARARFDYGVALLRTGNRRAGRAALESSYDGAQACGARGLANQAYEELQVAGARPRRPTFTGVAALTASERRVAQLAAEGKTNRDIAQALYVTLKTVENQLGRVYLKLDVASRRDLGAALAADARGPAPSEE